MVMAHRGRRCKKAPTLPRSNVCHTTAGLVLPLLGWALLDSGFDAVDLAPDVGEVLARDALQLLELVGGRFLLSAGRLLVLSCMWHGVAPLFSCSHVARTMPPKL